MTELIRWRHSWKRICKRGTTRSALCINCLASCNKYEADLRHRLWRLQRCRRNSRTSHRNWSRKTDLQFVLIQYLLSYIQEGTVINTDYHPSLHSFHRENGVSIISISVAVNGEVTVDVCRLTVSDEVMSRSR